MLQANSVALVTTSVPGRMRLALSVQAAAQAIGLGLGPTLGGLITQTAGWRGLYWINVPVGCLAVLAGRYLLPRTRHFGRTGSFDWPPARPGTGRRPSRVTSVPPGPQSAGPIWSAARQPADTLG